MERRGSLLAVGVVSAPEFELRRLGIRSTWLQYPNVGVSVRFLIRSRNAPPTVARALALENKTHNDILGLDSIAWNETRLRGPVLCLAAWLRYAAAALPHARFVAKVDDDTYIHTPQLERMLRAVLVQSSAESGRVYMGVLNWCGNLILLGRGPRLLLEQNTAGGGCCLACCTLRNWNGSSCLFWISPLLKAGAATWGC